MMFSSCFFGDEDSGAQKSDPLRDFEPTNLRPTTREAEASYDIADLVVHESSITQFLVARREARE
jgi:hypothetical protein